MSSLKNDLADLVKDKLQQKDYCLIGNVISTAQQSEALGFKGNLRTHMTAEIRFTSLLQTLEELNFHELGLICIISFKRWRILQLHEKLHNLLANGNHHFIVIIFLLDSDNVCVELRAVLQEHLELWSSFSRQLVKSCTVSVFMPGNSTQSAITAVPVRIMSERIKAFKSIRYGSIQ